MNSDDPASLIGTLLAIFVPFGLILANFGAWERRTTNRRCIIAIVLALAVWFFSAVLGTIRREGQIGNVVVGAFAVAFLLMCIASIVFAIVGLVQIGGRPGRYTAGMKRAICALVIDLVFVGSFVVGTIVGMARLHQPASVAQRPDAGPSDRRHVAVPPAQRADPHYVSPHFGFSVDLTDTEWTRAWPSMETAAPNAEFGVLNSNGSGCLCVMPVYLGEDDLDLDALTHALLHGVGVEFPGDTVRDVQDYAQGPLQGRSLSYSRKIEGNDFEYRARILRGRGCAYLMAAWMARSQTQIEPALLAVLDRVRFAPPPFAPPRPDKFNARERAAHALMGNEIGLYFERAGRLADAARWFRRGFEFGEKDAIILTNYVSTCLASGQAAEAFAYLDVRRAKFPGNQKLGAFRAKAQLQSGDVDGALKSYAALFDAGYRDDAVLAECIAAMTGRGQTDEALKLLDGYAGGKETPVLRRIRAQVLLARQEFDPAIALLLDAQKAAPNDIETRIALADAYFAAHRHADAIAECDRLIADRQESAYVYRRKGFAEFSLKRFREAKASFEKAHAKEPANDDLKRMLDHVSGMLGEGGNSSVKTPIEPVEIAAPLLADGPAVKADAYLQGFSAWYERVVTAIAYARGRESKTTQVQVIRVRDQQGVEKFSTLEFSFDPLGEEIFVNGLTVQDASGAVVATGRVEDSYVVDDGVGETATQRKLLHVPVPALKPGGRIEITVTRRTSRAESFDFVAHHFAMTLPVLRNVFQVQTPRDAVKWEATPGVPAPERTSSALTWVVEQPIVYRYEPLQAPLDTFLPVVWLGDASATWPGEAKEYLTQIQDRLTPDPALRDAVTAALKGARTDAEKTATLARFVQRELTYKAIEFGRRARVPNPATQTLRNKYGDCKDHALLLRQLLDSAGIPARLALVSYGSDLRAGLPSMDQFNHMIVYIPAGKGGAFLDCTGKSTDLRNAPPLGLAAHTALVLDPEHPRLEKIPDHPTGCAGMSIVRAITFPAESDIDVREEVTFSGVTAASIRMQLLAVEPANRTRYLLAAMNRGLPTLDLRDAQAEGIDDPQGPVRLRLNYLVRQKFQAAAGQLIGQLPAVWERIILGEDPVDPRLTPFRVLIPQSVETHLTVAPPAGWQITPAEKRNLDGPYYSAACTSRIESGTLVLDSHIARRTGQFPAGEYRAFLDATNAALGLIETGMVLKHGVK